MNESTQLKSLLSEGWMKKHPAALLPACCLLFMMALMFGCTSADTGSSESSDTSQESQSLDPSTVDTSGRVSIISDASVMQAGYDWTFSDRDLDPSYDEAAATKIVLSDGDIAVDGPGASASGSSVTIIEEGTYIVSGAVADGSLTVDLPGETDKAQIVLAGASITSSDGAALLVENADKVFITLAEGSENIVADGSTHAVAADGNDHDGAIFSHDDITFNGSGSLTVEASYNHGIVGKDDVRITGGTYTVRAVGSGIQANDSVRILDGDFTITAGSDGIHTSNDEDIDKGHIGIGGGTYRIAVSDDAIHAEGAVLVAAGTIDITESYEGLEGSSVSISGGNISIVSSDDGVNAASGDNLADDQGFMGPGAGGGATAPPGGAAPAADTRSAAAAQAAVTMGDVFVEISGGTLLVKAGGDGIDSNGPLTIAGGDIIVESTSSGMDGALDAESGMTITGGTLGSVGPTGMAQGFSGSSTQVSIMLNSQSANTAGKALAVVDSNGNEVYSFTPATSNRSFIISAPGLNEGETYTITSDGQVLGSATAAFNTQNSTRGGGRG